MGKIDIEVWSGCGFWEYYVGVADARWMRYGGDGLMQV
jgi:hypothetical protein